VSAVVHASSLARLPRVSADDHRPRQDWRRLPGPRAWRDYPAGAVLPVPLPYEHHDEHYDDDADHDQLDGDDGSSDHGAEYASGGSRCGALGEPASLTSEKVLRPGQASPLASRPRRQMGTALLA